jgi:hypothetical protein
MPSARGAALVGTLALWALATGCSGQGAPNPPPADGGGPCVTGQRLCRDLQTALRCVAGELVPESCTAQTACNQGFCDPVICTPGPTGRCAANNTYERCNEAGTSIEFVPCPGGTVCTGNGCAGAVCTVGEKRCKAGSATAIEQCSETGGFWEDAGDCGGEQTGKVCLAGGCEFLCRIVQQVKSSLGCDYWAVDLDNAFVPNGEGGFFDAAAAQFAVIVSNPHPQFTAFVQVHNSEGMVAEAQVRPGMLHVFNLPRRDVNGTSVSPHAYQVKSNFPIIAYQFNPLDNVNVFSNDASLLLPNTSLGMRYLVMTRAQDHDILRSFVTVVAARPGATNVFVKVTAPTEGGPGLNPMEPGDQIQLTLNQFEVLNLETRAVGDDLTGTEVIADKEVAVFGGSEASNVPSRPAPDSEVVCCADHLEMQMFSEETWGYRYVAAHFKQRGVENDYWRIMAREDGTRVITIPHQVTIPTLNRGEWFELESPEDFEIHADKTILVGQFMASSGMVDPNWRPGQPRVGDPAFSLLAPQEQWRKDYVFLVPLYFAQNFVNIVKPASADVTLDQVKIPQSAFTPIGTGTFQVIRLPVTEGQHVVIASEPVQIIVYGYDRDVSYGYPGGLNLEPVRP